MYALRAAHVVVPRGGCRVRRRSSSRRVAEIAGKDGAIEGRQPQGTRYSRTLWYDTCTKLLVRALA